MLDYRYSKMSALAEERGVDVKVIRDELYERQRARSTEWDKSTKLLRNRVKSDPLFLAPVTVRIKDTGRYNARAYVEGFHTVTIDNDPTLNHAEMCTKATMALCAKYGWGDITDSHGDVFIVRLTA